MRPATLPLLGTLAALAAATSLAPAQPAPAGAASSAPAAVPAPPAATAPADPMLAPPPPAPRSLRTWREGLRLARQNAPELRTAALETERAQADARVVRAGSLPTLTGSATLQRHLLTGEGLQFRGGQLVQGTLPDPLTTFSAGLTLRVPVLAGKAWHDAGSATRAVDVSRLRAKDTERRLLASLAIAMVQVLTAERLAEVSRASLGSALTTLRLTERRASLGGGANRLDVVRAEQEVAAARAQVVRTDDTLLAARDQLGATLGSDESWGVASDVRIERLDLEARSVCRPAGSLEERSDVRHARASADLAERRARGTDWLYAPTVDAASTLTWVGLEHERLSPTGEPFYWTVSGVLTWQLYDGGARYGTREQARSQAGLSRQQLRETRRQARLEISRGRRAVDLAERTLAVSRSAARAATEAARLARVAYQEGAGTAFELTDADRREREAAVDVTVKDFEVARARIGLLIALAECNA
ncbi:MAG: TolC family protein [Polyangiaceae bacterium]|nr:TolC family protein [Polyangiaceae bacterium]